MKLRSVSKYIRFLMAALIILAMLPWASLSLRAAGTEPSDLRGVTPQAIWTEDDATLTFICESTVYDTGDTFRGQTVTDAWKGTDLTNSSEDGPAWEGTADETAEKVVFEASFAQVRPVRLTGWFRCFVELTDIEGLTYLNTSEVTDMTDMFRSCNSLESLDLSSFDTSKVTSMEAMFINCRALTSLKIQNFNTVNVADMTQMFFQCSALSVLDLSGFDLSKVQAAGGMFAGCSSLTTIFCKNSNSVWSFASANSGETLFGGNTSLKGRYGSTTVTFSGSQTGRSYAKSAKLGGYFTPKSMTVTFNASGGQGSMAPFELMSSFYTSESTALPANAFFKSGAVFAGWNTKADGSGTAYADKAQVSASEDLTLYAQWQNDGKWWTRLAGSNRYGTMAAVVREAYEDGSCTKIIVATGSAFPDALSGSSLAGVFECPVILTAKAGLSAEAKSEIERLASPAGCTVYILGGKGAVSLAAEEAILGIGSVTEVKRVSASNRELTALKVYEAGLGSWGDTVILATGYNYADALAISPYAYASKTPILLGKKDKTLSNEVKELLESGVFTKAIIVGGKGAISLETEAYLRDELHMNVLRLSGSNRYETSAEIIRWTTGMKEDAVFQPAVRMTMDGMGVATGSNFADALGSVSLLGKTQSVLLLVTNNENSRSTIREIINDLIVPNARNMTKGYIFGGKGAVNLDIEALLEEAVQSSLQETAQAVYTEEDQRLTFIYGPLLQAGDTFNGKTVKMVWSGESVTETDAYLYPDWFYYFTDIDSGLDKMVFDESFAQARPSCLHRWFAGSGDGSVEGLEYLNTSEVKNMSLMFWNSTFTSIDLSHFDTSKVTDMSEMFAGSVYLEKIFCGSADTDWTLEVPEGCNGENMFQNCPALKGTYNGTEVTFQEDQDNGLSYAKSAKLGGYFTPKE